MHAYIYLVVQRSSDNSHISSTLQKHVLTTAQSGYPGCRQTEETVVMHCKKYLVKMTTSAWLLQFQGSLNRWVA